MEDFNPGSPQQVSHVLAERGAYDVFGRLPYTRNTKTGRPTSKLSSNAKVLGAMNDPLAALILLYRQKKTVSLIMIIIISVSIRCIGGRLIIILLLSLLRTQRRRKIMTETIHFLP